MNKTDLLLVAFNARVAPATLSILTGYGYVAKLLLFSPVCFWGGRGEFGIRIDYLINTIHISKYLVLHTVLIP